MHVWVGPRRPDGTSHQLMITLVRAEAAGEHEKTLGAFLGALKERRIRWSQDAPEYKSLGTISFLGADWSATDRASAVRMRGFMAVGSHDGWVIALASQDVAAHADETLALAERSFKTLRLDDHAEPGAQR